MTDTKEWPTTLGRRRALVRACDESADGTVVRTGEGDRIAIDACVDDAAARRIRGAFRRIDRVEIHCGVPGAAGAVIHAVGHRLPVHRRIPVGVALGLARLGVPTVVDTTTRGEA